MERCAARTKPASSALPACASLSISISHLIFSHCTGPRFGGVGQLLLAVRELERLACACLPLLDRLRCRAAQHLTVHQRHLENVRLAFAAAV